MLLCKPVLLSVKNETRRRSFTQNSRTVLPLHCEDLKTVQVDSLFFFLVAAKTSVVLSAEEDS